ncbi:protein NLRC5 [Talpa occidentalis]|uniref:protein NLRC5 n=1 Tax=Talpa occidentalis TaxID=50954 RepID=UPI0018903619|nr:protein NLRC5 [Talpa occidentalis]
MDPLSIQLGSNNLWSWLVSLLCTHLEWLNAKVKFFLPNMDLGSRNEATDPTERVNLQLKKLYTQGQATWQGFINCVCMELSVPLDMEVLLLSMWGHGEGFPSQVEAGEESQPEAKLNQGLKRPHQNCGSSPRRKQCKQHQRELAKRYLQLLRTSALQRYGSGFPGPGPPPSLHQPYIPPILQWNRATAPFNTQEGAIMGDLKAEDDTDAYLRDLFNTRANKGPRVMVLLGKTGMGKTTLAHRLCQKWACGQLDRFQALFLFEFRQLKWITSLLTLPQLLFDLYLSPEGDPDAVLGYLTENADGVLLIFDGLDEALHPSASRKTAGPEAPDSALTLFSDLCHGTVLPGCWVMATSRPGKLPAFLPTEAAMVHMWGFDRLRMEEYVSHFFSEQPLQEAALAELQANGRLRSMCAVPALCRVACLCLHHLLQGHSPSQSVALLPTLTQNYLQMVLTHSPHGPLSPESALGLGEVALRGLETGKVIFSAGDILPPMLAIGVAHELLTSFCIHTGPGHQETGYAFTHLSLQEFFAALYLMANRNVDKDSVASHITLNSRWVLRTNARLGLSEHLPTFLAGLASHACRPFLNQLAQWDQVLGAKQAAVVQALKKLAHRKLTGPKVVELCHCVGETQESELAGLVAQNLPCRLPFHNFPLTYGDLAAVTNILGHRKAPIHLDFEGCPLEPCCPEALAGCGQVEHLSFKSRKCGDAFAEALSKTLPTMENLKKLGLAGTNITGRGISHLLRALPLCPQLEKVSLQDNQLKDQNVLDIVEVLPGLAKVRELDLSRNYISTSTLLRLTKLAVTCPTVRMLKVRQEDVIFTLSPVPAADLQGVPDLQGSASQRKETQNRSLTLSLQKCHLTLHDMKVLIAQLRECPHLKEVDLSENKLEDKGCQLMAEAVAQLRVTRKLKLDLSDSGLSVAGVPGVLSAVSTCRALEELHISLMHKIAVFTFAPEPEEQEGTQKRATSADSFMPRVPSELPLLPLRAQRIRLTHCGLQATHLVQLCKALQGSCRLGELSDLDLSGNHLGDEGAAQVAQLLPRLGTLRSLNLSENSMSLDAVCSLTQCFSALPWVLLLDISFKSQHVVLRGDRSDRDLPADGSLPKFPAGAQFFWDDQRCIPKSFCLRECQLEPLSLSHLCETLEKCPGPLEVKLSCEDLSEQSLETLLHHMPRLPQLSLLQLSPTGLSPKSPLLLANLFSHCPRLRKVDLRSLKHMTLHFRSSEEQEGGCYGRFTDCSLSPEHMESLCWLLSKCEDLSQLDLSANLLGDGGLRSLLKCLPQLPVSSSLDLSHNNISQEGALYLVETLPSCPRVREASVNLGPEQSFQIHFSLQEEAGKTLRLSNCKFGPEHVSRLATGLSQTHQTQQLTELTLMCCGLDLEQLTILLSLLRRPAGLLHLWVEEPWMENASVLDLLKVCAQASGNITEISISMTQIHVQLEFPQQENPEAMTLRLAHCDLGTNHKLLIRQLMGTCARLRQLSLSQVRLCEASSLLLQSLLPALCELKKFRLTSSSVSAKGLAYLAYLASGLRHCHHLEELNLSVNQLGEEGTMVLMGALESKCGLKRLDLSHFLLNDSMLAALTQGLSPMTHLQSLRLSQNSIGDMGCCRLSESLRAAAASLEELDLSHNQIGDVGVQHLAAILPELPEFRKIDLSANGISPNGGVRLVESLILCGHLEEMRLGRNALRNPTVLKLAQALPPHLRVLHLQSSHLDAEGALQLSQALDGCPHVEAISLAQNSLAGGVSPFYKGLALLRQIDLVYCELDDQTAKPLIASLVLCPALEEILLSWNLLGDEAAAELARVLPKLGQLKKVDLEKNRITARGAWPLAVGLAQGSGIQVIRLWGNSIAPEMQQHLQSQEPRLVFI